MDSDVIKIADIDPCLERGSRKHQSRPFSAPQLLQDLRIIACTADDRRYLKIRNPKGLTHALSLSSPGNKDYRFPVVACQAPAQVSQRDEMIPSPVASVPVLAEVVVPRVTGRPGGTYDTESRATRQSPGKIDRVLKSGGGQYQTNTILSEIEKAP